VSPTKVCGKCRLDRDVSFYYPRGGGRNDLSWQCRDCNRERQRNAYRANPAYGREKSRRSLKLFREKDRTVYKDLVYAHYGGYVCVCCGETNKMFLTLDHINNNGSTSEVFGSKRTSLRYYKLYKSGYAEQLQVLCYNCNCGRYRNGGTCPHTKAG
jgi:hypothetical protein